MLPTLRRALILIVPLLIALTLQSLQTSPPFPLAYKLIDISLEVVLKTLVAGRDVYIETSWGRSRAITIPCPNSDPVRPPLVLFHGVTSKAADLLPVALAVKYQKTFSEIVLIDLQGHGETDMCDDEIAFSFEGMTDMALETLDSLFPTNSENAVLAGNSLGGLILFQVGLRGRKNPLYMISPGGAPSTASELAALSEVFGIKTHSSAVTFFKTMLSEKRYKPSLFVNIMAFGCLHRTASQNVKRIFKTLTSPDEETYKHDMSNFVAPTGLFWGKEERLLADNDLQYFKQKLSPFLVGPVDEPDYFGHVPFFDDPIGVARYIGQFADRVIADKSKRSE